MEEPKKKELCKFYNIGKCRFGDECRNLHEGEVVEIKKKQRNSGDKCKVDEDIGPSKKPPMKTTVDIISRLRWDLDFSPHLDDFFVGYNDRFKGLVERNFNEFNWDDDLASVDDLSGELAIPHHRIVYFKYKTFVIWDKPRRLDFIFGSTGNEKISMDKLQCLTNENNDGSELSSCSTDRQTGSYKLFDSSSDDDSEESEVEEPVLVRRAAIARPTIPHMTHFLAVRIRDEKCLQNLTDVLNFIRENEPHFTPFLYTPEMLHFTIVTLRLTTSDDARKAVSVAKSFAVQLENELLPQLRFEISGLSHFHKKILHAKVILDDLCTKLLTDVRKRFLDAGVDVTSKNDDIPHVTLAKVQLKGRNEYKVNRLLQSRLESYRDMTFGEQLIDNVGLCCTGSRRRDDGYYVCGYEHLSSNGNH